MLDKENCGTSTFTFPPDEAVLSGEGADNGDKHWAVREGRKEEAHGNLGRETGEGLRSHDSCHVILS